MMSEDEYSEYCDQRNAVMESLNNCNDFIDPEMNKFFKEKEIYLPEYISKKDDPAFWDQPYTLKITPWLTEKEATLKNNYGIRNPNVCFNTLCSGCVMPEGLCCIADHTSHCKNVVYLKIKPKCRNCTRIPLLLMKDCNEVDRCRKKTNYKTR